MGARLSEQEHLADWSVEDDDIALSSEVIDLRPFLKAVELYKRKGELENELRAIKSDLADEEEKIAETMIATGFKGGRFGDRTVYSYEDVRASAKAGQMDDLCAILIEHGYEDKVHRTVHANTLTSIVKEFIEDEGEVPEDILETVNVMRRLKIGYRKR